MLVCDSPVSRSGAASFFFFNDTATTEIYTLSLHDALPISPSKTGFTFTPANQAVTISGANVTAVNFTAQAVSTWSISGTISSGGGSTVSLGGAAAATTTTDASGNYTFPPLANGNYTVTPGKAGVTFTPAN